MDKIEKPVVYTMIRPVCSEREGKYVGCYIAKESDKYWEQEMFVKLRKLTLENEDLQRELEAQKQKLSVENIEKVMKRVMKENNVSYYGSLWGHSIHPKIAEAIAKLIKE